MQPFNFDPIYVGEGIDSTDSPEQDPELSIDGMFTVPSEPSFMDLPRMDTGHQTSQQQLAEPNTNLPELPALETAKPSAVSASPTDVPDTSAPQAHAVSSSISAPPKPATPPPATVKPATPRPMDEPVTRHLVSPTLSDYNPRSNATRSSVNWTPSVTQYEPLYDLETDSPFAEPVKTDPPKTESREQPSQYKPTHIKPEQLDLPDTKVSHQSTTDYKPANHTDAKETHSYKAESQPMEEPHIPVRNTAQPERYDPMGDIPEFSQVDMRRGFAANDLGVHQRFRQQNNAESHSFDKTTDQLYESMVKQSRIERDFRQREYNLQLRMLKDLNNDYRRLEDLERRHECSRDTITDVNL